MQIYPFFQSVAQCQIVTIFPDSSFAVYLNLSEWSKRVKESVAPSSSKEVPSGETVCHFLVLQFSG